MELKQEGIFKWVSNDNKVTFHIWANGELYTGDYIAFTVAELGEMLPEGNISYRVDKDWYIPVTNPIKYWMDEFPCKTEANARAKMLIYLLENKIMSI